MIAGRYALVRPIGHGGMSSVYLANDERLGRQVAVKLLHPSLAGDPSFVERFRREAQSAAGLNHPSIAAVYDWGADAGDHYLVMEYVPGSTLKEVILRRGRRPEREALHVCREIAAALNAAHRHLVVHRDVKPQNVLLDTEGGVKVVDFGIALATGESQLTRTGTILGSAHYASPEQIQRQPVDARSDLYSLGAVLYELLTGRPPFMADSPVAIAWQHVHESPEPPSVSAPGVSDAAERITLKALGKDPSRRYQTASELIADVDAALSGRPLSAGAVAPVVPPPPEPSPAMDETQTIALPPAVVATARPRQRGVPGVRLLAMLAALILLPLSVFALRPRPAQNVAAPAPSATPAAAPADQAAVAAAIATAPPVPTEVVPTTVPAATAPPAAVPPTRQPTPEPSLTPVPVAVTDSPVTALSSFYGAAATGNFSAAAALWSPRMRAQYPPAEFIDRRFAQTHSMTVNAARVVEQTADRAVLAVDLTEVIGNPPETRRWVGTWTLVRSGSAWLLDAPNLAPG